MRSTSAVGKALAAAQSSAQTIRKRIVTKACWRETLRFGAGGRTVRAPDLRMANWLGRAACVEAQLALGRGMSIIKCMSPPFQKPSAARLCAS